MQLPVRSHPEAEADLLEAALYLAERSPDAASQFLAAITDAISYIEAFPRSAPALPDLLEVRRRIVTGSPYAIIYSIEPEHLLVVAYEHVKRRPGHWLRRVSR